MPLGQAVTQVSGLWEGCGNLREPRDGAVRVVARDDSRAKAKAMFPAIPDSSQAQLEAYKVMENDDLFNLEAVRVKLKPEDLPGRPRSRVTCEQCGESVNDGRERRLGDRVLCRSCAGERYYELVTSDK